MATTKCMAAAIENVLLAARARDKARWEYEKAVTAKDLAISHFHSTRSTQCLLKDAVSKAEKESKAEAEAVKAKLKWHSKCVVVPAKAAVRAAKAALAQNPVAKYLAAEEAKVKAAAHAEAMAKTSAAAAKARAATKAAKAVLWSSFGVTR